MSVKFNNTRLLIVSNNVSNCLDSIEIFTLKRFKCARYRIYVHVRRQNINKNDQISFVKQWYYLDSSADIF